MFDKLKQLFGGGSRVDIKQRFTIKGKSLMGSMSQVFRAIDRQSGKQVCLKLLDRDKTEKFEARFAGLKKPSEGEICLALHHPNIVETYEFGVTTNNENYLVMEWVDGPGLQYMIEQQSTQLRDNRARYLAQVADALEYMHQQRFLHRDICPRNVIIAPGGAAKLIDFGLTIPYQPEFCKPGNRTGTPQYLAPEIIKRTTTDHRVDLFALGVTAYETYTGQLPWGAFSNINEHITHLAAPPSDPREHAPELDEASVQFLLKAIEREPNRRFRTAAAFRDALNKLSRK